MEKETVEAIIKGGLLKAHKKKVMVALAIAGAVAAYLVGDVDLVSMIQNAVIGGGITAVVQ